MADRLSVFVEAARARIDAALDRYLPSPPVCPALVCEAMRYSVFPGGKRLRPLLTLAAADAVAGSYDLAIPAACASELLHSYSLVHDDLPAMDNDTLRRGRPTLHTVYGDAVAILAGDALQAEAFALASREPPTDDPIVGARKLRVVERLAAAAGAAGMVGGQTIDLQAAGQVPAHRVTLDAAGLQSMHDRKTGALIKASALVGAIMAGASVECERAIVEWAGHIGLAFQIVDDILDVEGSASELGKTAGKDAATAKPTYPSLFGLDRSRGLAIECAGRARAVLADAGLTRGWLNAIGDWVVTRRS